MTKLEKELQAKISQLEERIKQLEARPAGQTHHHYHYRQEVAPFVPAFPMQPMTPDPWWTSQPWCSNGNVPASGTSFVIRDDTPKTFTVVAGAISYGPEH